MLVTHFFELGVEVIEMKAGDALFPVDAIPGDQYTDVFGVTGWPFHPFFQVAEQRAILVDELAERGRSAEECPARLAALDMNAPFLVGRLGGRVAAVDALESGVDGRGRAGGDKFGQGLPEGGLGGGIA